MGDKDNDILERRATYVALSAGYVGVFTGFNLLMRRGRKVLSLRPFDLVLLGFAVYRLGRLVAYDKVMESYRALFTRTVPDPSGAGESVEPKRRSGFQQAIGELLSCPICSGTWIAAGLVYALALAPRPTRMFLAIMSSMGVGELLNAATEAMSWLSQETRDQAGLIERHASTVHHPMDGNNAQEPFAMPGNRAAEQASGD
jgi:uncharacterized protein DUF1360